MIVRPRKVYIDVRGQDDNVGDSLLRRGLIAAVERTEPLSTTVLVGRGSDEYLAGLQIPEDWKVERARLKWYVSASAAALTKGIWLILNSGEVSYTSWYGRRSVVQLVVTWLNRQGRTSLLGIGLKETRETPWRKAVLAKLRAADDVMWRDDYGLSDSGIGGTAPDWGFSVGGEGAGSKNQRNTLAVSFRGDRGMPPGLELDDLSRAAKSLGLTLTFVAQVKRDAHLAEALAREADAEYVGPSAGDSHRQWEAKLRDVYVMSAVVVSDRLHVLVAAATEGAGVAELTYSPSTKASRNFDTIGYHGLRVAPKSREDSESLRNGLSAAISRRSELSIAVKIAREKLAKFPATVDVKGMTADG